MASNYPMSIDQFTEKLNFREQHYEISESFTRPTSSESYIIKHSNPENIVVKEDSTTLTLGVHYSISTPDDKPWIKIITSIGTDPQTPPTWTVTYTTDGDENDADDINSLSDSIVAIEQTLGINPQGEFEDVKERLDYIQTAIDNFEDGTIVASYVRLEEELVLEPGQTLIELTRGSYDVGREAIDLYIFGQKLSRKAFIETSQRSVTLKVPAKGGERLLVDYIQSWNAEPYITHGSSHLTSGSDPIPVATSSSDGLMSKEDKAKLDNIDTDANEYVHPDTHPASMITETSERVWVSPSEKAIWNNKQDALGYIPENPANKGMANGYAPLDDNAKIPSEHLPEISTNKTYIVSNIAARDALTGINPADRVYVLDAGDGSRQGFIWSGAVWLKESDTNWENINLKWGDITGRPNSAVLYIDDAVTKRHAHSNIDSLNSITAQAISQWNTVVDKVDKIPGKGLSTEDFTTAEKLKLSLLDPEQSNYELPVATSETLGGIKVGANLYITPDGVLSAGSSPESYIVREESFVTTEGQTIFTLTKGTYIPGKNMLDMYVMGQKQPTEMFNEINSTTIESKIPFPAGIRVIAKYIQVINMIPYPEHGNMHITGEDPIPEATTSNPGLMSASDKTKLDSIASGAETNQNAFSNIKVGALTISADSKTDTLELAAGTGVTLMPDATNDKVTINIESAPKLTTARTITLTGDVSGSASFDGSTNISITVTVSDDSHNHIIGNIDGLQSLLDSKETPTGAQAKADAALANANTYTDTKISQVVGSSPEALDTLYELAQALGNDPNFATTVMIEIGTKETPEGAQAKVNAHANRTDNPHGVTKSQVGLGSVSDYGIATQAEAQAGLATNKYMTPLRTKEAIDTLQAVKSVSGKTGTVTLSKSDVGLGNVDNTSDLDKPISTATQNALDNKVDKITGKGLSTEDYTSEEKTKLAGIAIGATKVENSTTNGNIKINDSEVVVYTHPGSGTNPHGTTKSDIGLSNVLNYGIATQAEAESGSSNSKYMTPLRVAQEINSLMASYINQAHSHSNKSILDKITQSGVEQTFDLSSFATHDEVVGGGGTRIYVSDTQPSNLVTGDHWIKILS
jgi:hypothetical protein